MLVTRTLFLTGNYHTEIYDTGIQSQNKVNVIRNEQISSFLQHKEAGKMCGHKNIVHYLGFFFLDIWVFLSLVPDPLKQKTDMSIQQATIKGSKTCVQTCLKYEV